jgi:hypothetical protein
LAPTPRTDDETEPPDDEAYFLEKEFSGLYDDTVWDVIECYLNLPEAEHPENNPLSYAYIRESSKKTMLCCWLYSINIRTITSIWIWTMKKIRRHHGTRSGHMVSSCPWTPWTKGNEGYAAG